MRVRLHYGSKRSDIGNRWRSGVNSLRVGTVIIVPKIPVVTVKVTMPWAMPPIGIAMGAVIIGIRPAGRLGLGGQGA